MTTRFGSEIWTNPHWKYGAGPSMTPPVVLAGERCGHVSRECRAWPRLDQCHWSRQLIVVLREGTVRPLPDIRGARGPRHQGPSPLWQPASGCHPCGSVKARAGRPRSGGARGDDGREKRSGRHRAARWARDPPVQRPGVGRAMPASCHRWQRPVRGRSDSASAWNLGRRGVAHGPCRCRPAVPTRWSWCRSSLRPGTEGDTRTAAALASAPARSVRGCLPSR